MFKLLKLIIWLAGILVITYFALGYFGYEPNFNYFQEAKARCKEKTNACAKELVEQGTKNAKCYNYFDCIDLEKIIIKKR